MSRENLVAETFVQLTDTLVDDFEAIDVMHLLAERSVELLGVDAAGLILADPRGSLEVVASTSHAAGVIELFALQDQEGPCLDCIRTGTAVVNVAEAEAQRRWPRFTAAMLEHGYRSTHALPLRLRRDVIGAINLFGSRPTKLSGEDQVLGQALADVATISLLQERAASQRELLAEQLQSALNTRVLIEQAKGSLAERAGIGLDEAFAVMRSHSRSSRRPLSEIANAVIDGSLDTAGLLRH